MRVIAHRGFADDAPENTVTAVRAASRIVDAVEVDVRRCGSGELVLLHDERVDRVTDGCGAVADLGLDALRRLRVRGTDERVPTLAEALEAAAPGTAFVVELKEVELAADALAALDGHDGPTLVSSFEPAAIAAVAERRPTQPTALTAGRLRDRPVRTAARLGCAAVHLHYARCLVPGVVRSARAADLAVEAWTVRRRATARLLARRGVDGLMVDAAAAVPDARGSVP